jgi:hypothetical protein
MAVTKEAPRPLALVAPPAAAPSPAPPRTPLTSVADAAPRTPSEPPTATTTQPAYDPLWCLLPLGYAAAAGAGVALLARDPGNEQPIIGLTGTGVTALILSGGCLAGSGP